MAGVVCCDAEGFRDWADEHIYEVAVEIFNTLKQEYLNSGQCSLMLTSHEH